MASPPTAPELTATTADGALRLSGDFTVWTLESLPAEAGSARLIDLAGVKRLDTAAALYLAARERARPAQGRNFATIGRGVSALKKNKMGSE